MSLLNNITLIAKYMNYRGDSCWLVKNNINGNIISIREIQIILAINNKTAMVTNAVVSKNGKLIETSEYKNLGTLNKLIDMSLKASALGITADQFNDVAHSTVDDNIFYKIVQAGEGNGKALKISNNYEIWFTFGQLVISRVGSEYSNSDFNVQASSIDERVSNYSNYAHIRIDSAINIEFLELKIFLHINISIYIDRNNFSCGYFTINCESDTGIGNAILRNILRPMITFKYIETMNKEIKIGKGTSASSMNSKINKYRFDSSKYLVYFYKRIFESIDSEISKL